MINTKKQTIFLTVSRAIIVRNLLFSDFFNLLKDKYNVVLISSLSENEDFQRMFSSYTIVPLYEDTRSPFWRKIEDIIIIIHKGLIYNSTVEVRTLYGLLRRGSVRFEKTRYYIQKYFFGKILGHKPIRTSLRCLDRFLFPSNSYDSLIEKYDPCLVFSTSISDNREVYLLRNCKAKGVKTVGMAKSWDNASKFGFREKADKMIVWSEYMKEEVIKFQDYNEKDIKIIGVPQFDYYKNLDIYSKQEFFRKFGLDEKKKTIFFGSEGPVASSDPYIVALLKKKIEEGVLSDYQILVRPHFSYDGDQERFLNLIDNKIVFADLDYKRSDSKDGIELSLNNVVNLIAASRYSDVAVTSASTLLLDVIANGRNAILYAFDEDKNINYKDSTKRLYDTLWFREIRKMGLNNMAKSEEGLLKKIKEIIQNPEINKNERENVIERFCYKIDGDSGKRLFETIDQQII